MDQGGENYLNFGSDQEVTWDWDIYWMFRHIYRDSPEVD